MVLSLVAGTIVIVTGCGPLLVMDGPSMLERGEWSVAGSGAAAGQVVFGGQRPEVLPQAEASARVGLSDSVNLGVRAWTTGLGVEFKYLLLHGEGPVDYTVAVAPVAGVVANATADLEFPRVEAGFLVSAPLLIGCRLDSDIGLVLAPGLTFQHSLGSGLSITTSSLALAVAYRFCDRWSVIPELGVRWTQPDGLASERHLIGWQTSAPKDGWPSAAMGLGVRYATSP